MTGFLFAGISNTALADNVSVPDSKNDAQTIGTGNTASGDDWSVEVGSDNNKSVYSVGDKNAISLRDNAVIHIKKNAVVTNEANRNIGNFGTGANTIEVRSGSKITVDGTVQSMARRIWAKRSTFMVAAIRSLSTVQSLLKKRGDLVSGLDRHRQRQQEQRYQ